MNKLFILFYQLMVNSFPLAKTFVYSVYMYIFKLVLKIE